jgi:hypothetical protein
LVARAHFFECVAYLLIRADVELDCICRRGSSGAIKADERIVIGQALDDSATDEAARGQ